MAARTTRAADEAALDNENGEEQMGGTDEVSGTSQPANDTASALQAFFSKLEQRLDDFEDSFVGRLESVEERAAAALAAPAPQPEVLRDGAQYPPKSDSYPEVTREQMTGMIPPPGARRRQSLRQWDEPYVREPTEDEARALKARNEREVAFIPKDDPLNPRNRNFDGWVNGKRIRIRRNDVGMVPLGVALDWAKSGHGHVIDISAMTQGPIRVEQFPDESDADSAGPVVPQSVVNRY